MYYRMTIVFIFILVLSSYHISGQETVNQCCIVMDVFENGKISENEYEIWDFSFDPSSSHFSLGVASFVKADEKNFYTYIWNHEAKSIKKTGDGVYEIICTGRMSAFDMHMIVCIKNQRINSLKAWLPIGTEGKAIKEFKINNKKKTLSLSPIHNSAYSEEKKE